MTWQRFTGLDGHRHLPDARTLWAFKELLAKGSGADALFEEVGAQLAQAGFKACGGQLIDATFITVAGSAPTLVVNPPRAAAGFDSQRIVYTAKRTSSNTFQTANGSTAPRGCWRR